MIDSFRLVCYPCPLCGSSQYKKRFVVDGLDIVECLNCEMVYVSPRVCNEQIVDIYKDRYFQRDSKIGYQNYVSTAELRRKTFRKWYSQVEPCLPSQKGRRALDIGCAAGYFLEVLEKNGWQAEGIELDSIMFQQLKKSRFSVYNVPVEQFVPDHKYHLITLFDVLEHLPDLDNDFRKFREMLVPEGTLVLVTPNLHSFQSRILGRRWYLLKPLEHITYFSPKTLKKMASKHGFTVTKLLPSGQYADVKFIKNRLKTYNYKTAESIFSFITTLLGLSSFSWYTSAGSMLAVLKRD
ncbi:MAG: class I SAM-dependent methyltransferase [Bacteroidota bacterium]